MYLYVIDGRVTVNGRAMATGSAAQVRDETAIVIEARPPPS